MSREFEIRHKIDAICNRFEENWAATTQSDFESLLDQVDPDIREPLLRALLEVDLELRIKAGQQIDPGDYRQLGDEAVAFVEGLIAAAHSPSRDEATIDAAPNRTTPFSKQIGPYKLLQQIGEGGMGTVWMAEQEKPVKRRVALKVIKAGVGSKEVITRFEAERQALSLMNHSNIARILDVGTTEDGQPYFAMELVQGKPLTTYCDDNRVSISERLQLFAEVCSGVQHAHQKGIIHRDLKPSNILVAMVDGKPVPKVIDFGLAKALESTQRLTDQSLFTGIGQILGTLKYMSPEQASLDLVDIDTRTDIYSLGVILYELLTGSTPLDNETVRGEAMLNVLQIIRDKEPARPSSRLSTDKATLSSITNSRRTDSSSLNRILVGDLDWVVVKALEKDRSRRYESASGLAADIQRFLNNEPVTARPPSAVYRIRKFVRKNRGLVMALGSIAALLVVSLVAIAAFARNASLSRDRAVEEGTRALIAKESAVESATRATNILQIVTSSFRSIYPEDGAFKDLLAQDVLAFARDSMDERLGDDPLGKAKLLNALRDSFIGIGKYQEALEVSKTAWILHQQELGPDEQESIGSASGYVHALYLVGEYQEAMEIAEPALKTAERLLGRTHSTTCKLRAALGSCYSGMEDSIRFRETYRQQYEWCLADLGSENAETLNAASAYAAALSSGGRHLEAIDLYRKTIETEKLLHGPSAPEVLITMRNLAEALKQTGKYQDAIQILRQVLDIRLEKFGEDHPKTWMVMTGLGSACVSASEFKTGIEHLERALDLQSGRWTDDHPDVMYTLNELASAYSGFGAFDKAIPLIERSIAARKKKFGPAHRQTLKGMSALSEIYGEQGNYDLALRVIEEIWEIVQRDYAEDEVMTLGVKWKMGSALSAVDKPDKAIVFLDEVYKSLSKTRKENDLDLLKAQNDLALAYRNNDQADLAIPLFEANVKTMSTLYELNHANVLIVANNLALCHFGNKNHERAIEIWEDNLNRRKNVFGVDHPSTVNVMNSLAMAYFANKQSEQCLQLLNEAVRLLDARYGKRSPHLLNTMNTLAVMYYRSKRFSDAQKTWEQILDVRQKDLPQDDGLTIDTLNWLAAATYLNQDYSAAEKYAKQRIQVLERRGDSGSSKYLLQQLDLAESLVPQRRFEESETIARKVLQSESASKTAYARANGVIGFCRACDNKFDEAEKLLLDSYEHMQTTVEATSMDFRWQVTMSCERLITLYEMSDQPDKVAEWKTELEILQQRIEALR